MKRERREFKDSNIIQMLHLELLLQIFGPTKERMNYDFPRSFTRVDGNLTYAGGLAFLCMEWERKGQETGLAVYVSSHKSFMQDGFSTQSTEAPWLNLLLKWTPTPFLILPERFPVFGNI